MHWQLCNSLEKRHHEYGRDVKDSAIEYRTSLKSPSTLLYNRYLLDYIFQDAVE